MKTLFSALFTLVLLNFVSELSIACIPSIMKQTNYRVMAVGSRPLQMTSGGPMHEVSTAELLMTLGDEEGIEGFTYDQNIVNQLSKVERVSGGTVKVVFGPRQSGSTTIKILIKDRMSGKSRELKQEVQVKAFAVTKGC